MTKPFTSETEAVIGYWHNPSDKTNWIGEAQIGSWDTAIQCLNENDNFESCYKVVCFNTKTGLTRDVTEALTHVYCTQLFFDADFVPDNARLEWLNDGVFEDYLKEHETATDFADTESTYIVKGGHAS